MQNTFSSNFQQMSPSDRIDTFILNPLSLSSNWTVCWRGFYFGSPLQSPVCIPAGLTLAAAAWKTSGLGFQLRAVIWAAAAPCWTESVLKERGWRMNDWDAAAGPQHHTLTPHSVHLTALFKSGNSLLPSVVLNWTTRSHSAEGWKLFSTVFWCFCTPAAAALCNNKALLTSCGQRQRWDLIVSRLFHFSGKKTKNKMCGWRHTGHF